MAVAQGPRQRLDQGLFVDRRLGQFQRPQGRAAGAVEQALGIGVVPLRLQPLQGCRAFGQAEGHALTAAAHRGRQAPGPGADQQQHGVAGRLLEGLEEAVARLGGHALGRIDECDLGPPAAGESQPADQIADAIDADGLARFLRLDAHGIGMRARRVLVTGRTGAARGGLARARAQQRLQEGLGKGALACAAGPADQQRMRQAPTLATPPQALPGLGLPRIDIRHAHGAWARSQVTTAAATAARTASAGAVASMMRKRSGSAAARWR